MAKYRRKRQDGVVDAIFCPSGIVGHYGESLQSEHRPFYFSVQDGALHYWPQEGFEGEYERVEKEPAKRSMRGICCGCERAMYMDEPAAIGYDSQLRCEQCNEHYEHARMEETSLCVDCGRDRLARVGLGDGRYVCLGCDVARQDVKKSKPITLGDFMPGDIFCIRSSEGADRLCQHMGIRGGKHRYWAIFYQEAGCRKPYLAEHLWSSRDRIPTELAFIRHHDLTPKQLLWIAATPEEREALKDSIRDKWLPRTKGKPKSSGACALCALHTDEGRIHQCGDCIIHKDGEPCEMPGSPWRNWRDQTRGQATLDNDWVPLCPQDYKMSRNMTISLSDFLPNIHPLRIEVEATPEEWPGAKKYA